jgi:hypothetical protein
MPRRKTRKNHKGGLNETLANKIKNGLSGLGGAAAGVVDGAKDLATNASEAAGQFSDAREKAKIKSDLTIIPLSEADAASYSGSVSIGGKRKSRRKKRKTKRRKKRRTKRRRKSRRKRRR